MVETISPVVHGGRTGRWAGAVALHALGATVAAAAAGAVLGALGMLAGAPFGIAGAAAVAVVAVAYAARDLLGLRFPPLVEARRQVPEWWRTFFSPAVASFLYGAGLGVGFFTYLGHGTLVVVAVGAVAAGEPWLGAAVMAPFGLARAAAPLASRRARTAEEASGAADRVDALGRSRLKPVANGVAALAVAAGVALAVASRSGPADVSWDASRLAPVALAVVFAWAALAKAVRPDAWRRSLAELDLPRALAGPAVVAVPAVEAATAVLLVGGLHRAGGAVALVLLGAFSGVLVSAVRRTGTDVPCGCFGKESRIDVRLGLLRNAALAALAVASIAAPEPTVAWGAWSGGGLPVVLVGVGLAAGTWIVVKAMRAMRPGADR